MSRLDKAENNMDKWYGLALGQCIEELQAEVKGLDDYDTKSEESGVIFFIGTLQAVTSRIDSKIRRHLHWTRNAIDCYNNAPSSVWE